MRSKKLGIIFFLVGVVLIFSALSLLVYNVIEDIQAGKASQQVMLQMREHQETILLPSEASEPENTTNDTDTETVPQPTESLDMKEVEIDGYNYIGYITIPSLDLELPVMSNWTYEQLKIAPCRQQGNAKTDDLVILAHNYDKHFGYLEYLSSGAEVLVTDMDGQVFRYAVDYLEKVDASNASAVLGSNHDLVLYTCTPGGNLRVVAFCDRSA